jgi:hypothetical protein
MAAPSSSKPKRAAASRPVRRFSLEQANRALPLVRRIVTDIVRMHSSAATYRDALENTTVVGTHGVFVMSPQDHNGLDNRARVMIRIDNGKWVLAK